MRSIVWAIALFSLALIAANSRTEAASFNENRLGNNESRASPDVSTGSAPRNGSSVGLPVSGISRLGRHAVSPVNISGPEAAEPHVILLRGWFGVFSTGLDSLAEKLRASRIEAELAGHLSWYAVASGILRRRAAGETGPLVLVGHSQGANNAIVIARWLRAYDVKVDLLVTLAPFAPPPIPGNVVRAVNYYQFPGWGSPLAPDASFAGTLSNINLVGDLTTFHITIDKESRIHNAILREIGALQATSMR